MLRPYGCVEFAFRVGIVSLWCSESVVVFSELDKNNILSKSETTPRNITADVASTSENIAKSRKLSKNDRTESPTTPLDRLPLCINTPENA